MIAWNSDVKPRRHEPVVGKSIARMEILRVQVFTERMTIRPWIRVDRVMPPGGRQVPLRQPAEHGIAEADQSPAAGLHIR